LGAKGYESRVVKRSVVIAGRKTSVNLEDAFWKELKEIASGRDITLSGLIAAIDSERRQGNLSSASRLFVLEFLSPSAFRQKGGRDGTRHIIAARAASGEGIVSMADYASLIRPTG
jgi:predicted DNA-binding ribbon-helix-helix protein